MRCNCCSLGRWGFRGCWFYCTYGCLDYILFMVSVVQNTAAQQQSVIPADAASRRRLQTPDRDKRAGGTRKAGTRDVHYEHAGGSPVSDCVPEAYRGCTWNGPPSAVKTIPPRCERPRTSLQAKHRPATHPTAGALKTGQLILV